MRLVTIRLLDEPPPHLSRLLAVLGRDSATFRSRLSMRGRRPWCRIDWKSWLHLLEHRLDWDMQKLPDRGSLRLI